MTPSESLLQLSFKITEALDLHCDVEAGDAHPDDLGEALAKLDFYAEQAVQATKQPADVLPVEDNGMHVWLDIKDDHRFMVVRLAHPSAQARPRMLMSTSWSHSRWLSPEFATRLAHALNSWVHSLETPVEELAVEDDIERARRLVR